MNKRTITVFGMSAVLVLGACGSDAPKAMSEDDFVDTLTSLCEDAKEAADEADLPSGLDDFDGIVDYADEGLDVLGDLLKDLQEIVPPKDFADDFAALITLTEDKLDVVETMKAAAEDEDDDGVADANDEMGDLLEDQGDIAEDLDIPACAGSAGDTEDPVTSVPGTDASLPTVTTLPGETTLPGPDVSLPTVTTLPSVTLPVVTLPTVPETAPPSPDPSGGSIEIATLADLYAPPAGYTLVDRTADQVQGFVDVVASFPTLAASVSQIGAADLYDSSGFQAATIAIAVTYDGIDVMPSDWTLLLCDPATSSPATSPGGQSGTNCPGTTESGIIEAFTLETGPYGFSIVTFDATISAITLFDEFATANT